MTAVPTYFVMTIGDACDQPALETSDEIVATEKAHNLAASGEPAIIAEVTPDEGGARMRVDLVCVDPFREI